MASVQNYIQYCLTQYPGLFPTPLKVLDHAFCTIGTGVEWRNGEIADMRDDANKPPQPMRYDDLDERDANRISRIAEYGLVEEPYMKPLTDSQTLEVEALRNHREWTERNLDRILQAKPVKHYGPGSEYAEKYYKTKGVALSYCNALNFPDDITKEWGDVLWDYLDHWNVTLNVVYGVSGKPNLTYEESTNFWPDEMKTVRDAITAAKHRLFPLINDGESLEEHNKQEIEMIRNIMAESRKS